MAASPVSTASADPRRSSAHASSEATSSGAAGSIDTTSGRRAAIASSSRPSGDTPGGDTRSAAVVPFHATTGRATKGHGCGATSQAPSAPTPPHGP